MMSGSAPAEASSLSVSENALPPASPSQLPHLPPLQAVAVTLNSSPSNLESPESARATTTDEPSKPPLAGNDATSPEALPFEKLEATLRSFITVQTIEQFSRKSARQQLESVLGLEAGALEGRKAEVNQVLRTLVVEYQQSLNQQLPVPPTPSQDNPPVQDGGEEPSPASTQSGDGLLRQKRGPEPIVDEPEQPMVKKSRVQAEKPLKRERKKDETADEEVPAASRGEKRTTASSKGTPSQRSSSQRSAQPKKREKSSATGSAKSTKATQGNAMTRKAFLDTAKSIDCRIGKFRFALEPKLFSTGSCGWYYGGKTPMKVGSKNLTSVIGLNCTIVGSKTWVEGKSSKKNSSSEGSSTSLSSDQDDSRSNSSDSDNSSSTGSS